MVSERQLNARMVSSLVGWCVVSGVLLVRSYVAGNNVLDTDPPLSADSDDHLLKQVFIP